MCKNFNTFVIKGNVSAKCFSNSFTNCKAFSFCLSIANPGRTTTNETVSLTIGLLINDQLRKQIRFLNDPNIPRRIVNTTCEQCQISDCEARAAAPKVLEHQHQLEEVRAAAGRLDGSLT